MKTPNRQRRNRIRHGFNVLASCAVSSLLGACATVYVEDISDTDLAAAQYEMDIETGVRSCRSALASSSSVDGDALDASGIRLVNWNIRKQLDPDSDNDLTELSAQQDLILIQEASLRPETINHVDATKHWSFAPGYRKSGSVSGVLTLSTIRPLTQCSFSSVEPLLRSPKATSITEYGLSSGDETLVVVNMHAVNFSIGLKAFKRQFNQVAWALDDHEGPIIFSGDLNTWRKKRMEVVQDFAEQLGLQSIEFDNDQRVTRFGNILDHIYVRGLTTRSAVTEVVETSDHNPMSAVFAM